jgi:predicted kinase
MKKVVLFAGMPAVGKSSIANHLSWKLGLAVFSSNILRAEVHQDTHDRELDIEEFNRRRDARFKELVESGQDFILDASIDRTWPEMKPKLEDAGYEFFIISFDLSDESTDKLVSTYPVSWGKPPKEYRADHQNFLNDFANDVKLTITDENYSTRLDDALNSVKTWLEK